MSNTFLGFKISWRLTILILSLVGFCVYWFLKEYAQYTVDTFSLLPIFGLGGDKGGAGGSHQTGTAVGKAGTGTVKNGNYAANGVATMSQATFNNLASQGAVSFSTSYGSYSTATYADGSSVSWSGNDNNGNGNSSTPFLLTWDGEHYKFENDFLFGKPNTAFNTYAEGLVAYKAGIGGDTYLIQNKLKVENGFLKFQIKEIEPEESFIDSFKLTAVDMPTTHYPVTDGNLTDTYIFDTTKTITLDNQVAVLQTNAGKTVSPFKNGYSKLGPTENGKDTTLHSGDKIIVSLLVDSLIEEDVFLMVDSYFRDWTLGNQVPFTFADRMFIQTKLVTKMFPVWCAALVMGGLGLVTKNVNADVPSIQGYGNQGYGEGTYYNNSKSLVITANLGVETIYLQTIFPRYIQASQEVVRIPVELLKKALGSTIEICITATKKHKVRSAFLFKGTPTDDKVIYTPLTLESAIKRSVRKECADDLAERNGVFLHTLPADVIDVSVKDAPLKAGYVRHYVLQAHGFYTKLSTQAKNKIGDYWYDRLDGDSKKLLKNLRVNKA